MKSLILFYRKVAGKASQVTKNIEINWIKFNGSLDLEGTKGRKRLEKIKSGQTHLN